MSWPYDTHMGVSMRGRGGGGGWIVVLKWSQGTSFYICLPAAFTHVTTAATHEMRPFSSYIAAIYF